jgi:hypothetical protein
MSGIPNKRDLLRPGRIEARAKRLLASAVFLSVAQTRLFDEMRSSPKLRRARHRQMTLHGRKADWQRLQERSHEKKHGKWPTFDVA